MKWFRIVDREKRKYVSGKCFRFPETPGMNYFPMEMKPRPANAELSTLSVREIKIDTPSSRQKNVIPPRASACQMCP